jgi:hydrogenase 3 maturation protease
MKRKFTEILKGKVVIVGIGNVLRGDDGFGPLLIEKLNGTVDALCFDAGTAPENYIGKIIQAKPDTVLFVDAVSGELNPGEYEILDKTDILGAGFTTHDLSPKMLIEFLEKETTAAIFMLGVQPQSLVLGDGLSEPVKKALYEVEMLIREVSPCMKHI